MDIVVEVAPVASPGAVAQLLQLYLHDLSEFDGRQVGDDGRFPYPYLDLYGTEPDRHAFLIRADGEVAGFALVRETQPTEMAEFFVLRRFRRGGVGRAAATTLLHCFPGEWRLTQLGGNVGATAFWRSVIPADHTEVAGRDVEQRFTVR